MRSMLNTLKKIGLVILALSISFLTNAEIKDLPVKIVNGKRYHYYEVQPKETVYSLCRKLGITRQELVETNPSVADGLKAYQLLLFPLSSTINANHHAAVSEYKVQQGETGYGISRKFGMTLDEFYQLNPSSIDGINSGQIVKIKTLSQEQPLSDKNCGNTQSVSNSSDAIIIQQEGSSNYLVKSGDTFFGIAQKFGLGVDQLRAANKDVDILKEGMTINLPQACCELNNHISDNSNQTSPVKISNENTISYNNIEQAQDTLVIALALPLNATTDKRDARAVNAIEFYRGFMMSVDSLCNFGKPLKILTYDTQGSEERVNQILVDKELKKAHVILSPDEPKHLDLFAKYAEDNKIYLLNQFVIKDESYKTKSYVIQSNIPHESMYQKAVDYYVKSFKDKTPVFLKRSNGKVDKIEFVNLLKKALSDEGEKYHEIEFKDKLSLATLSQLPDSVNYAFIPVSSSISELNRFVSAINNFKEGRLSSNISLFGYPEWLIARGETLEALHEINSYIFSRFYSVDNDFAMNELKSRFRQWYGVGIADKIPRQGVYGFDTGMFLIRTLNNNNGDFSRLPMSYYGNQNSFDFIKENGGGFVNDELYIINFAPGNIYFKFLI